jgi:hypothetical protein
MKIFRLILILLFTYIKNQIPIGYSLNSCGKDTLGYNIPNDKSDCSVNKDDNFKCCLIKSVSENFAYCSYVPGKVDKEIIEDFKETLEINDLEIDCNKHFYLKLHFLILYCFFILLI